MHEKTASRQRFLWASSLGFLMMSLHFSQWTVVIAIYQRRNLDWEDKNGEGMGMTRTGNHLETCGVKRKVLGGIGRAGVCLLADGDVKFYNLLSGIGRES